MVRTGTQSTWKVIETMGPWEQQTDIPDVIPDQQEAGWTSGSCAPAGPDPKKVARVLGLYGRVLDADQIQAIALIETEFDDEVRPWEVYPGIGWPKPGSVIYARRQRTVMSVLMADDIPGIYEEVRAWVAEHKNDDWAQS